MKTVFKTFGIITIAVIIVFSMATCSDPCSHSYGEWDVIAEANCTTGEMEERTCSSCGHKETQEGEDLDPDNHDLELTGNITTPPTCEDEGVGELACTRCEHTEAGVIEELGHQGLTPAFAATCTAAGNSEASGTCTRAGCVVTGTVIGALGHQGLTPAFAATCTVAGNSEASGTCTRAGCEQPEVIGTVIGAGHDWSASRSVVRTGVEAKTCNNNGCNEISDINLTLALGDTGPAGGKIIYIAPTGFDVTSTTAAFTTYTAYYLEAAPANAVGGGTGWATFMSWSTTPSSSFPNVTGTLVTIGSGRNNTALIIAAEKAAYPSNTYIYAALACDNYSVAGFNDWFLPSRDELNQLYNRRADFGLSSDAFWSSSQGIMGGTAWFQRFFGDGGQDASSKSLACIVRPVRAF